MQFQPLYARLRGRLALGGCWCVETPIIWLDVVARSRVQSETWSGSRPWPLNSLELCNSWAHVTFLARGALAPPLKCKDIARPVPLQKRTTPIVTSPQLRQSGSAARCAVTAWLPQPQCAWDGASSPSWLAGKPHLLRGDDKETCSHQCLFQQAR